MLSLLLYKHSSRRLRWRTRGGPRWGAGTVVCGGGPGGVPAGGFPGGGGAGLLRVRWRRRGRFVPAPPRHAGGRHRPAAAGPLAGRPREGPRRGGTARRCPEGNGREPPVTPSTEAFRGPSLLEEHPAPPQTPGLTGQEPTAKAPRSPGARRTPPPTTSRLPRWMGTGCTPHTSRAYSSAILSQENFPMLAQLMMDMRVHRVGSL